MGRLSYRAQRLGRAVASVFERLENRQLMAGDGSIVQTLPYANEFSSPVSSFVVDKDGEGTGFTWVAVNKNGNEYQSNLMDLDTAAGVLKLTTTGTSANGGPNEGDNTLVNGVQTQFDATTGLFYISTRLVGPLSYISKPSQQGGIFWGDQDNYVKLVAVSQPSGNFLQFIDESKNGTTWVHQLGSNSYTSIGSFASINSLDLYLVGNPSTGLIQAYYKINGGTLTKVSQELTLTGTVKSGIFSPTARGGLIAMARNDLAPIDIAFDRFEIKSGTPVIAAPSVTNVSPAHATTGIATNSVVAATISQPNGTGIDASTISSSTVKLYRTSDNAVVSATLSLGANNTIVLTPNAALNSGTTYTFQISGALKDLSGATVQSFSSSFTTAAAVSSEPNIQVSAGIFYFNDVVGGSAGPTQKLTITNTGNASIDLSSDSFQITGDGASQFTLTGAPALPASLAAGASITLNLVYSAPSGTSLGIHTASLQINSNDPDESSITVALRGLATAGTGGSLEPSLQRVFNLFNMPINVGTSDESNYLFPMNPSSPTDEIIMPKLVKAGAGPVTITPLAAFAVSSTPSVRVGTYSPGTPSSLNELFTLNNVDNQTVNPTAQGATTFDPGSAAFSIYATFPPFSNTDGSVRTVYSEDVLNQWETISANRRKVRFYAMKNADGSIVPNTYIAAFEEFTSAYDQQDVLLVIKNVQAAPEGAEIGLENRDMGVPFHNRLIFSRIQNINQSIPNVVHDIATLRVYNSGTEVLTINSMTLTNTTAFKLNNTYTFPLTIAANSFVDVPVKFIYSSTNSGVSTQNGTLTINTNDADEPTTTVTLAGLWQSHSEATPSGSSTEHTLKSMIAALGYKTNVLSTGQNINSNGLATPVGEEVMSHYWQRADSSRPVTVKQLAAYHTQGNGAQFRWHTKGSSTTSLLFTNHGPDSQSMLPHILNSSTAYAMGSFSTSNVFGFKVDTEWSDDTLNIQEQPGGNYGHHMRFWPARDQAGNVIKDTWLMSMDYNGINYDYNDNIYLISNVRPANPPAPTGLAAVNLSTGVSLDWTNNTDKTTFAYNIYRSSTSGGTYTKINAAAVINSEYLDNSATVGVTYFYKVAAIDNWGGESSLSTSVSGKRLANADVTPPAKPLGLTITLQHSPIGLVLDWSNNSESDLDGYNIYRSTSLGGTYTKLNVSGLLGSSAYTDEAVTEGVTYYYQVTAVDVSGNESTAATTSGKYTAPVADNTVTLGSTADTFLRDGTNASKNYGTGTTLEVKKDGVSNYRETWIKFDLAGITDTVASAKLRLYGKLSDPVSGGINVELYDANDTSWTETGLTYGTKPATNGLIGVANVPTNSNGWIEWDLTNWLMAQQVAGKSQVTLVLRANKGGALITFSSRNASTNQPQLLVGLQSGEVEPPPTDTTPPADPTGVIVSQPATGSLLVDWADNSENDLAGYDVYRATTLEGTYTKLNSGLLTSSVFSDTSVQNGVSYYYQVKAIDTSNNVSNPATGNGTYVAPTVSQTVTLGATADSTVRDGTNASKNYGTSGILEVKKDGVGNYRESYLKFDLTTITDDITSATLRIWGKLSDPVSGGIDVTVYEASSSEWTETGITFSTRPAATTSLATANVPSTTGQWMEWDLTAWLIAQKAAGKTEVTLALKTTKGGALINFNSRNAATNQPQLKVEMA